MSNGDVFLRATIPMKESPSPPGSQAVIETLVKVAHTMQETSFQWTFIDKPKAGSSALVYHDPARPWPADGVRYSNNESTQNTSVPYSGGRATLETCIIAGGIYPPSNPAVPLPQDTPELNLARFRLRFRIVPSQENRAGHPALWYVYWGRDDRGGHRAPPGWEREVVRRYPLPPIDQPYQYPLRGFAPLPAPQQQQQQQQLQGPGGQPQQPQQQQQQLQHPQMPPQQQQQHLQMQMQQQQQQAQRTPMQLQQGQNPQYMQQQQQAPQQAMQLQGPQPGLGTSPMSQQPGQPGMPGLAQSRPRSTAAMNQQMQPQQQGQLQPQQQQQLQPGQGQGQMSQQQLQQQQMQMQQMLAARQQQQQVQAQAQAHASQQQGRPGTASMPPQQMQRLPQDLPGQMQNQQTPLSQSVNLPPHLAAAAAAAQVPNMRGSQGPGGPPTMLNGSGVPQLGQSQAGSSVTKGGPGLPQPQLTQAQQLMNAQQLAQARMMMSTATFPAPFDDMEEGDPYELLSPRSWAGLRYERNHALIAPIFDAATVEDCLLSWKAPALPTLEELKAQIKAAEEEIVALKKAGEAKLAALKCPSAAGSAGAAGTEGVAPGTARSASMTGPSSTSMDARRSSVMSIGDPLLAPLPQLMSIAEMEEGAMQAITARRQAIEQVQKQKDAVAAAEREAEEKERREAAAAIAREEEEKRRQAEAEAKAAEEESRVKQKQEQSTMQSQPTAHQAAAESQQPYSQPASSAMEVTKSHSAFSPLPGMVHDAADDGHEHQLEGEGTGLEGMDGDLDFSLLTGGNQDDENQDQPSHDVFASFNPHQQEHGHGHGHGHGAGDEDAYLYAHAAAAAGGDGLGMDGEEEESLFDTYFNSQQQH